MSDFLSDEWVADLDAALRHVAAPATPTGPGALATGAIEYRIEDRTYHLTLNSDGIRARCGPAPLATVVFSQSRATAEAIGRGQLSGQAAVQAGDVVVGGDPTLLLPWRGALGKVDGLLNELAASTRY